MHTRGCRQRDSCQHNTPWNGRTAIRRHSGTTGIPGLNGRVDPIEIPTIQGLLHRLEQIQATRYMQLPQGTLRSQCTVHNKKRKLPDGALQEYRAYRGKICRQAPGRRPGMRFLKRVGRREERAVRGHYAVGFRYGPHGDSAVRGAPTRASHALFPNHYIRVH